MSVLYLTEQGSLLRKTGERLIVEKDDRVLAEIQCLKLETVLVYGNVQITTQALAELLDHGIELALLSRSGKLRGQLTPPKAKNVPLRMRQYDLSRQPAFCLELAREIVRAKVENGVAALRRFRLNHPDFSTAEAGEMECSLERVAATASPDELRGVEGNAAARYFAALGRMVPASFGFDGRNRRPPRDPLNALLSFGYVLVGNELQSLLDAMGFDPYLGFYHQLDYGRPSLALDLLEEVRPALVDRLSTALLNLGTLDQGDFTSTPERGCFLQPEGLKRYFRAYESELTTPLRLAEGDLSFRQVFRRQAERLARALVAGEPYQGFRLPC
jgi:CRISPR-associated protein Cas1